MIVGDQDGGSRRRAHAAATSEAHAGALGDRPMLQVLRWTSRARSAHSPVMHAPRTRRGTRCRPVVVDREDVTGRVCPSVTFTWSARAWRVIFVQGAPARATRAQDRRHLPGGKVAVDLSLDGDAGPGACEARRGRVERAPEGPARRAYRAAGRARSDCTSSRLHGRPRARRARSAAVSGARMASSIPSCTPVSDCPSSS